jgi:hypothetical protein
MMTTMRRKASAANPRRKIDHKAIEDLAASIRTDVLLHMTCEGSLS